MGQESVIRLLLISQDEAVYKLIDKLLSSSHQTVYQIIQAAPNDLESPSRQNFDVILTQDLAVLYDNGTQTPVIVLAETDNAALDRVALEAGASAFLCIPGLTAALLDRTIRYVIQAHQRENALREDLQELQAVVQDHTALICRITPDHVVTFINDAYATYLGSTRQNIVGRKVTDFLADEILDIFLLHLKKISPQNPIVMMEYPAVRRVNQPGWNLWTATGIYNRQGELIEYQALGHDITRQKKIELALQESEILYRSLVELSPEAVVVVSEGKTVFVNDVGMKLYGAASRQEVLGRPALDFIPPDLRQEIAAAAQHAFEVGRLDLMETRLLRLDGIVLEVEVRGVVITYQNKPALMSIFRDISDRKQTEARLIYQAGLLENINDAVISTDNDFHIISWNKGAEAMYGWSADEVLGQKVYELFETEYPDQNFTHEKALEQFFRTGQRGGEVLHRCKNGQKIHVMFSASQLKNRNGEIIGTISVNRDITSRKQAEARLSYQASLLQNIMDAVVSTDPHLNIISWNQGAEQIYGWSAEDAIGKNAVELLRTEYPNGTTRNEAAEQTRQQGHWRGEAIHYRKDGTPIYVYVSSSPVKSSSGQIIGYVGVNRDITEHKQDELQIQYQASLLRNVSEAVMSADRNLKIISWNPGAEAMYGWTALEAIGETADLFFKTRYRDGRTREEARRELFEQGYWRGEAIHYRKDGQPIDVLVSTTLLRDDKGATIGYVAVNRDITRQKEAERQRQLFEAEKERVMILKRFIGDATHDLVTPLTIIQTSLYLLRKIKDDPQKQIQHLNTLDEQTAKLEKLLENMLSMSRLDNELTAEFLFHPEDINQIIQDIIIDLHTQIDHYHHQVSFLPGENIPRLSVDKAHLHHALEEVLTNAIIYTPVNGTIQVKSYIDNGQAVIQVQDNGIGIKPQHIPHIFDSFYRADEARNTASGSGGLGLSIAKKVIEAHQGSIEVESTPNIGSIFRIRLPITMS